MTKMSRERRECLYRLLGEKKYHIAFNALELEDFESLLADSARLERIERQVRELADDMDQHMEEMRKKPMDSYREGRADTADYYGYELRAIVDTGGYK